MSYNVDAKLTVEVTIKNCIDRETLENYFNNNIETWVRELLDGEGLFGIVEDDYTIVKVEEL